MSVFISALGGAAAQFFDSSGNPLTGGLLYSYAAGTTTPQATYTSSAGSTAHTNPIVLDAAGRVARGGGEQGGTAGRGDGRWNCLDGAGLPSEKGVGPASEEAAPIGWAVCVPETGD